MLEERVGLIFTLIKTIAVFARAKSEAAFNMAKKWRLMGI